MNRQIILLNGPSSSGKSSIARTLKDMLPESAVISIDDFLKMSNDEPIYEDDVYEITPAMCGAIKQALDTSQTIIIDHVITSPRIFSAITAACAPRLVLTVRVACPPEILAAREAARNDRCPGSASASEEYLYPKDGYHMTVNTGEMSPEECAREIFRALQTSK